MMRRVLFALLFASGFNFMVAQTPATVTLTATHLTMGGGGANLPDGSQLCVMTTDANDRAAGYSIGGGGQTSASVGQRECHPVTGGSVQGFTAINSAASGNACLRITEELAGGQEVRRDKCVQTGTPAALASGFCSLLGGVMYCDYGKYTVSTAPMALVQAGPPGPKGDTGCNVTSGTNCTTDLAPRSLNAFLVHAQSYPGSSFDQQLNAAQNAWAGTTTPVVFAVDTPATLAAPVTLATNRNIEAHAPLTFATGAQLTLSGTNRVSCVGSGTLNTAQANAILMIAAGNGAEIDHCTVYATGGGASFLLAATGTGNHFVHDNPALNNIGAFLGTATPNGSVSHIRVTGNTITNTGSGAGAVGMTIGAQPNALAVTDVLFSGNSCSGITYCGVINLYDGASSSRAIAHAVGGGWTFIGNNCFEVFSCTWTGPGYDIKMADNHGRNCHDQCYDLEGAIDSVIEANTCYNDATVNSGAGLHACASVFGFSNNITISGETYTLDNGATAIAVKNVSADPSVSMGLTVHGSTVNCPLTACTAVGTEAAGDVTVAVNKLTNARVDLGSNVVNGVNNVNISLNVMEFALPVNCAICAHISSGLNTISLNTITQSATLAGSTGINVIYDYFNAAPEVYLDGNRQLGSFATDIQISNNSGNSGLGLATYLTNNWTRNNTVTYSNPNNHPGIFTEFSRYRWSNGWQLIHPYLSGTGNVPYCVDSSGREYRGTSTGC